jgi:hypothetical protein
LVLLNAVVSAVVAAFVTLVVISTNLPATVQAVFHAQAPVASPSAVRASELARRLDIFANIPNNRLSAQAATNAARELQAQAESESTSQAQAALALLSQVNEAIAAGDSLELNRLAVLLRNIH